MFGKLLNHGIHQKRWLLQLFTVAAGILALGPAEIEVWSFGQNVLQIGIFGPNKGYRL